MSKVDTPDTRDLQTRIAACPLHKWCEASGINPEVVARDLNPGISDYALQALHEVLIIRGGYTPYLEPQSSDAKECGHRINTKLQEYDLEAQDSQAVLGAWTAIQQRWVTGKSREN